MRRALSPAEDFRRRAHARLSEVGRRFARGRLLAQLAILADAEERAILCSYCSEALGVSCPEHRPREAGDRLPRDSWRLLTDAERERVEELRALGNAANGELEALAPERSGAFYDFAFGGQSR